MNEVFEDDYYVVGDWRENFKSAEQREEEAEVAEKASLNEPEPNPTNSDSPAIWDLVVADMQERDGLGEKRYGTRLQADNGRDPLVDAYQEALDLAVYLRQEIYERYGK